METNHYCLSFPGTPKSLWRLKLKANGRCFDFPPPVFRLDGKTCRATVQNLESAGPPRTLRNGAREECWQGAVKGWAELTLAIIFRLAPESPVLRFAYKQVREAITRADPVRQGIVGGSPELHEKIDPANGHGAVAVFAEVPSTYRLVTRNRVAQEYVATEGVTVRFDTDGRALLDLDFRKPGAKLVFFGVKEC
jgi:hypothetical protein